MAKDSQDLAASVHQRLLNEARKSNRPFNELLQHFAIERFIYRLSKTRHAEKFVLKGALMFSVWSDAPSRPTMDIDFLARIDNSLEIVAAAVTDACRRRVAADGVSFDAETVTAARITEGAAYEGVRVRVRGSLGNARISIQIDIGFGDVIVPGPRKIVYPGILDFPAAELKGYTMESTIAEKFQAMVRLGVLNSRMKDFYDIWTLSHAFDFQGDLLAKALEKTFERRSTPIANASTVFDPSFARDVDRQRQWQAFLRKARLVDAPGDFKDVVATIKMFLRPLLDARAERRAFHKTWTAPGPWR